VGTEEVREPREPGKWEQRKSGNRGSLGTEGVYKQGYEAPTFETPGVDGKLIHVAKAAGSNIKIITQIDGSDIPYS